MKRTNSLGQWLITLVFVASILAAAFYWQEIVDWWRLRSYQPSAEIVTLADNTTMIGRGRQLFYVSNPQLNNREVFNQNCTDTGEESLVLGCYRLQSIYLYNVTDPRLDGVKEVTAAHEMLHAAYERLSSDEKKRLNAMLEPQIKAITDQRLSGLIKLYNKHEPGELYNEMHSILGTEARYLSAELEEYYKQYFADRSKVVNYSENYEGIFLASKARIAEIETELAALKQKIDTNNARLSSDQKELQAQSAQLDQLRQSGDTAAYNQAVPGYNARVHQFNALVVATQAMVDKYNTLVEEHNKEAAAQSDLYHSLDSQYQVRQ